jgi:mannosyltransferase OCH1-like enzyme
MIPKFIHYVWVGGKPMDDLAISCLRSWEQYFPDYEIVKWDENNIPMDSAYVRSALANKKWSNVSNFVRLHSLSTIGGIYFDTDFEIIKRFDFLDEVEVFCGFEDQRPLVNSAVLGSPKNDPLLFDCINYLAKNFDGLESSNLSGPELITTVLSSYGLDSVNKSRIRNITIFPTHYFYPYAWDKSFTFASLKDNTYGIHHWAKTWVIDDLEAENLRLKNEIIKFESNVKSLNYLFRNLLVVFKSRLLRQSVKRS